MEISINTQNGSTGTDQARVATLLGVHESQVEMANNGGYRVEDNCFPFAIDRVPPKALQDWLSLEHDAFRGKGRLSAYSFESPQMRVGSGGASSMPPQQRNSIEINAPGEWKP